MSSLKYFTRLNLDFKTTLMSKYEEMFGHTSGISFHAIKALSSGRHNNVLRSSFSIRCTAWWKSTLFVFASQQPMVANHYVNTGNRRQCFIPLSGISLFWLHFIGEIKQIFREWRIYYIQTRLLNPPVSAQSWKFHQWKTLWATIVQDVKCFAKPSFLKGPFKLEKKIPSKWKYHFLSLYLRNISTDLFKFPKICYR